jgi:ATP-dependent Clp protease ATP-binding subunit ClpB
MSLGISKFFSNAPKDFPSVKFDDTKISAEVVKLEKHLRSKIIGQDRAIKQFVAAYETYLASMQRPDGPSAVLLFLGPTGVGKTRVMEVFAEYLWGNADALIRIDCGEFQHSHEIAKLIGAPAGYLGHGTTPPIFSKERIEKYWGSGPKFTPILFDEIEKGHNALHQLMLGINGAGRLRLGSNEILDMRSTFIVMTSNLGSRSIASKIKGTTYGFSAGANTEEQNDQDVYKVCKDAVKGFFSAEFVNRIDRMVAFRPLKQEDFEKILEIELGFIQDRVIKAKKYIIVQVVNRAKILLLREGVSKEFGARELRRAIERFLVHKLTRAFTTKQAVDGDLILVDSETEKDTDLTIMKGVIDLPPVKQVSTETWVRPEAKIPFPSAYKIGKCGRCGAPWIETHLCSDLERSQRMDQLRKKIDEEAKNPPPKDETTAESFWRRYRGKRP